MELSLKGKKILITGAGAGIGLACAEAFVTAGADVAICDVEQARLDEALASLTAIGGNHYGQLCDVASADAVADFFANSVKALGALDIVLNNAGVGSPLVPLEETDEADYDRLMGINLKGVWLCMRESPQDHVSSRVWTHHQHGLGTKQNHLPRCRALRRLKVRCRRSHAKHSRGIWRLRHSH